MTDYEQGRYDALKELEAFCNEHRICSNDYEEDPLALIEAEIAKLENDRLST